MNVHIIGASGRSGTALCRAMAADDAPYIPVVRNAAKWQQTGLPHRPVVADLADPAALRHALAAADIIVSCAHARHAASILQAAPATTRHLVLLGSTRKFTRWPDAHAAGVLAGEAAFLRSGRRGVILHPTMIYGAQGEDNVQRLARLLARLPLVPLPGGGTALVQPVYQDDVTRALRAAVHAQWDDAEAMVLAGADQISYAAFVRAVAQAAGLPPPRVVPVPATLLRTLAPLTRLLPGVPTVRRAEIRRLMENKAWDIDPLRHRLGINPITLTDGLAQTFASHTSTA